MAETARCGWCGQKNVKYDEDGMLRGHGKPGSNSSTACRGQDEQYAQLIDKHGVSIFK